ncbi:MAG TPA: hypothetical protein VIV40_32435, partial [Kofleriaceae bacterium]
SARSTVTVRAVAPRVCTTETWELVDAKSETKADVWIANAGGKDDPLALAGVILAPITLAVSGVVTALVIASSGTTVKHERRKADVSSRDCSIVGAGLPVTLTMPSGATAELVTGSDGRAYFDVPADESDDGMIGVRVSGLAPRDVRYCRAGCPVERVVVKQEPTGRAACLRRRSALMLAAQRVDDIKERTRQLTSLPVCPDR